MRAKLSLFCGVAAIWATPASAADALSYGKAPDWVVTRTIPVARASDAPVQVLLADQQIYFQPGKVTAYTAGALKIQNAQGLAAGNLALVWQPATDRVTVNKLVIYRDDKVIDVLANGQTFTALRRETNLDAAVLDGTLTATIQPEGLQEGDVIELATTVERSDPVLKGHVEATFADWDGLPIQMTHASLRWPSNIRLNVRQTPNLPTPQKSSGNGTNLLELSGQNIQPLLPPRGAPARFGIGRFAEATDFASWADLANLMIPLFRDASVIPTSGPLRDEVERLRVSTADPKRRAEEALALVQNRIRYVALLMGQGSYVPAPAEATWSRRFGDCKAKTALLLGILHWVGIAAEPVLVQSKLGDIIVDRLPMISLFDHVIVRAHIGGKDYWLDSTRTGDSDLDTIAVPRFGWGLPLVEHAQLVQMVPRPLDVPNLEHRVNIDASGGVFAPVPVTLNEIYRGDAAVHLNSLYSALTAEQRDQQLRDEAESYFDGFVLSASALQFDKAKRVLDLTVRGTAKLNWKDGWLYVPTSSVAFDPDFDRAAGPLRDVPWAINHPRYVKDQAVIQLPNGFAAQQKVSIPVHETLAGVEYARSERADGDLLTVDSSERSIVPEVPYKEATAAAGRLRALDNDDVYLSLPKTYHGTAADLEALRATKPGSAHEYFIRADVLLDHSKTDEGIADLSAGLALDPKDTWALMKRAAVYTAKQQFAEAERDLQAAQSLRPGDAEVAVSWGELAMSKGDLVGALSAFNKVLDRDPNNGRARLRRATILLQQGKIEDSLRELTAVLASDPGNAGALAQRAQVFSYKQDWAAAEKDIAAALADDPANAGALATKAMIALEQKDFETASQLVSQALAHDPNNSFARTLQARLLKREGNQDVAMRSLDEAVSNAPSDPIPLINRAFAHFQAKEFDAADRDISHALAIEPGNLRALQGRAEIASARGNYSRAVDALSAALTAFPSNGDLFTQRAEAYRQQRNFTQALADTNAALKSGVMSPSLRLLRINILIQMGDLSAVAAECDELLTENPSSDFALVAAGKTYAAIGMRDKAMASFDRALAIKPYAYIYINRSQVRPHADLTGKLADLDAALKIEPNQEDALAEKARLLSREGKHAQALNLYDSAIKSALDPSYLQLGRAVALERAGRIAEAKAAFEHQRATAKSPGDFNRLCWTKAINDVVLESALQDCRQAVQMNATYPGVNESLGVVLLKLGKLQEALGEFNKAVAAKSGADAFMGRAIVRARMGQIADARADAAEAHRLRPDIDDTFAEYGLKFADPSTGQSVAAH